MSNDKEVVTTESTQPEVKTTTTETVQPATETSTTKEVVKED